MTAQDIRQRLAQLPSVWLQRLEVVHFSRMPRIDAETLPEVLDPADLKEILDVIAGCDGLICVSAHAGGSPHLGVNAAAAITMPG